MNRAVAFLISISQVFNTLFGGGHPDQMLSSWAWENRLNSSWAKYICYSLDNLVVPLSLWRSPGMTHCESCWHFEKQRLIDRYMELTHG